MSPLSISLYNYFQGWYFPGAPQRNPGYLRDNFCNNGIHWNNQILLHVTLCTTELTGSQQGWKWTSSSCCLWERLNLPQPLTGMCPVWYLKCLGNYFLTELTNISSLHTLRASRTRTWTGCWLAAVPGGQTPPWGVSNTAWAEGSPWALPEHCVWLWALQVKEHVKVIEMPSEEGNTATEQSVFPPFVSPLDISFQLKLIKLKA